MGGVNAQHTLDNASLTSEKMEADSERRRTIAARCLKQVGEKLGYSALTIHQQEAILEFVSGRDVLVVLPTGSGKSVCFAVLPWLFDALRGTEGTSIVVIVSPLNSLMKDQVDSFSRKGLSSVFINSASVKNDPSLSVKVSKGMYQLVYIGPEMLIGQHLYREMLLSQVYQQNLVAFVVDEAHCIKTWGTKFRESFMRLGEARSLIHQSLSVMALTATAVQSTKSIIRRTLGMRSTSCEIVVSPVKNNVKFAACKKTRCVQECLHPLLDELAVKRSELPRTLIFCRRYKECCEIYDYFKYSLGKAFTEPPGSPDLSFFRLVDMYLGITAEDVKDDILANFANSDGCLQILICTSAFGMGVNCRGVERVYHWGPPDNIEMYLQEIGRAGRGDSRCIATLFASDAEAKGDFDLYCNSTECRRRILERLFEVDKVLVTPAYFCCDICEQLA